MTKTTILTKIKFQNIRILKLLLIFSLILNLLVFISIKSEAASTSFAGGQVSLDKVYVDGVTEVETVTTAPGDTITVRLKYSNTSASSATNSVIADSLPNTKFSLVSGSIKNCLINSNTCVTLNDSLFSAQNLVVNPLAGFFGYSDNSNSGNLEFGRKLYLHNTICSQGANRESYIQLVDNASIFSPNCTSVGGTVFGNSNFNLLGNRYLHQTICNQTGGQKESFVQAINNSATFTPSCSNLGVSVDTSNTFDLLGNRYLHQTICNQTGGQKESFVQAINNSATFTPDCSGFSGATVDTSSTTDLLFSGNSSGYIEYQMDSNIVEDYTSNDNVTLGDYGTNPSFSSNDFTTFSDPKENSISIKIYCNNISPVGATRNITLSDAELRTGQDFRCNYQASICPVVFDDINNNGQFDITDTRTSGVEVLLQNSAGTITIATITTTNASLCFENLAHGRTYRVAILVPPSGSSTTGGNVKTQLINYVDTSIDTFFGFSNGTLILNVPEFVVLPAINVSNIETFSQTNISPIQVIDTRLSNPGWTLTANVEDFKSTVNADFVIPVGGNLRNTPGSVQVNSGQTGGINIGDQKTLSTVNDTLSIFAGNNGSSTGNFQISSNIRLTVPAFTRATNYESKYIYTII